MSAFQYLAVERMNSLSAMPNERTVNIYFFYGKWSADTTDRFANSFIRLQFMHLNFCIVHLWLRSRSFVLSRSQFVTDSHIIWACSLASLVYTLCCILFPLGCISCTCALQRIIFFRYRKISHHNIYVILIWKISINARSISRSITDAISDIISHYFSQHLIHFFLYDKEMERNTK
jgi:hypothetical protein